MPLLLPELHWRLVGEALANGRHLYLDVYDDIGPLAGMVYQILYSLFGAVRWPYYAFSALLVIIQAGFFNQMLLGNKAYKENTYVPAFFYMIFMNMAFDFVTLPPILFSITFILLAINNVFKRIDNTTQDEMFLNTGIYLGIAVLFYLPLVPFFFTTLLSLLLFTGSIPRRIALLLFGFSLLFALAYSYYFWFDGAGSFHSQFVASLWRLKKAFLVTTTGMWWMGAAAAFVLLLSLFVIYSQARFANYQVKFQQVMIINVAAGFVTLALSNQIAPYLLIIFVPSLAFFAAHFVLEIRRRFWAEIITPAIFLLVCGWSYGVYFQIVMIPSLADFPLYFAKTELLPPAYHGKSLWVIGDDESYYSKASLGSPFLSWDLSRDEVGKLDYYVNVEKVAKALERYQPEVILDLEQAMPVIQQRIPSVERAYSKVEGSNYYLLRKQD